MFLKNTVREELAEADIGLLPFDMRPYLDMHPYDLSGGEQQLLALCRLLTLNPRLIMLDEPTKGLDANTKKVFADIIRKLRDEGATVLIVTHDVEFAGEIADRCALCFLGEICGAAETRRFFAENSFYTTAVSRMTRGRYRLLTTVDDAEKLLRINGRRA